MQFVTLSIIIASVFAVSTPTVSNKNGIESIGEGIACDTLSYCLLPKEKSGCPTEAFQGKCAYGLVCCPL